MRVCIETVPIQCTRNVEKSSIVAHRGMEVPIAFEVVDAMQQALEKLGPAFYDKA